MSREMTKEERELVTANIDEITACASLVYSRLDRDERVSLAYIAACQAAMCWKAERGVPFPGYAMVGARRLIRLQARRTHEKSLGARSLTNEDKPTLDDPIVDARDEHSRRLALLGGVMDNLTERQRRVVMLRSEGLTFNAIGIKLGIQRQTACVIFAGAVAWLRDTLAGEPT
jgi:RNA polymerase sigma factor (sigma-70 family)